MSLLGWSGDDPVHPGRLTAVSPAGDRYLVTPTESPRVWLVTVYRATAPDVPEALAPAISADLGQYYAERDAQRAAQGGGKPTAPRALTWEREYEEYRLEGRRGEDWVALRPATRNAIEAADWAVEVRDIPTRRVSKVTVREDGTVLP